jgi:hypothetical protein
MREIEQRLSGKKYGLGWFATTVLNKEGQDLPRVHCAIDEEPRLRSYVHGSIYAVARALPGSDGAGQRCYSCGESKGSGYAQINARAPSIAPKPLCTDSNPGT